MCTARVYLCQYSNAIGSADSIELWKSVTWDLPITANPPTKGDIVFQLQGASLPTVVRRHLDHLMIVMIAPSPLRGVRVIEFTRDIPLVWEWGRRWHEETFLLKGIRDESNKMRRLRDFALIYASFALEQEAEETMLEALQSEKAPCDDEEMPPITAKVFADIIRLFDDKVVSLLLNRYGKTMPITEAILMVALPGRLFTPVPESTSRRLSNMMLPLNWYRDEVQITETVLVNIVRDHLSSHELMETIIDRHRHDIKITEPVLLAAAEMREGSVEMMRLLFDNYKADIMITGKLIVAVIKGHWLSAFKIINYLLDDSGAEIKLTTEAVSASVLLAAVNNVRCRGKVRELLLERVVNESRVEEAALRAAMRRMIMAFRTPTGDMLLQWKGSQGVFSDFMRKATVGQRSTVAAKFALLMHDCDREDQEPNMVEQ